MNDYSAIYLLFLKIQKNTLKNLIITLLISIFICGCESNVLVVPKYCTEEPDFTITHASLTLATDTTIQKDFDVSASGYFSCSNIYVQKFGITKNINIYGAICKDHNLEMYITYNDTLVNSKLKAVASKYNSENYSGNVYYCANENNVCSYTEIGSILGTLKSNGASGFFSTPGFSGDFSVSTY